MFRPIFLLIFIGLFLFPASAQEIELPNAIVAETGLSVNYPAGWLANTEDGNIVITRMDGLIITVGDEVAEVEEQETLEATMELYYEALTRIQEAEPLVTTEISGRPAQYFVASGLPGIEDGQTIHVIFEGEDGTLHYAVAVSFTGLEEIEPVFFAILESAVYMIPVEPDGGIGDGAAALFLDEPAPDQTTLDGDVLTLASGLQFTIPEGFGVAPGTNIEDFSGNMILFTEDFTMTLTITDDGSLSAQEAITIMVPLMAGLAGDQDYTQQDLMPVTFENGLTASYYNSLESAPEGEGLPVQMLVIPVTGDRAVIAQLQGLGQIEGDAEALEATLFGVVESMRFLGVGIVTAEDGSISVAEPAECSSNSYSFIDSDNPTAQVQCPAGCAGEVYSIWGTDIYTDDSAVCPAAIHAGVITDAEGGTIVLTFVEGQDSYTGSERNGITTSDYGSWGGSFSVSAP